MLGLAMGSECKPMTTSQGKLSLQLCAFFLTGALSQLLGFAQTAPSITQQPQSQSLLAGMDATFNVSATGQAPLSYLWTFNGSNVANSPHISGATSASLIVSNIAPADAGNYQVVVANHKGSATSSVATLTVLLPPAITSQPADASVVINSNAMFIAAASGTAAACCAPAPNSGHR